MFACMSIGCHQFLDQTSNVYKQAVKYGERIIAGVKKSKTCAPLKQAFELSLKKIKSGTPPSAKDRINGEIPSSLVEEVHQITQTDDEQPQQVLWNENSLSFRYFNLL